MWKMTSPSRSGPSAAAGRSGHCDTNEKQEKVPDGEVGEVCLKGPILFTEYYQQPELTKAAYDKNGYFCTGDLGKYLENGMLAIVGRKKEMIIREASTYTPRSLKSR
jgi:long-chain acyl-CoA synthetase